MLRSWLERISRDRVLRRRLPPEYGGQTLFVSPDSALKFWRRDLRRADPLLLGLAAEWVRPGSTVWDVGANVGLFTFAAAYLAGREGRVLAVEADDWLTSLIRRSASTLPETRARVDILTAAVSASPGIADFCIAGRGRAGSHLQVVDGSTQTGGVRAVSKVVTVTLDMLLDWFPAPHVVKLDVEGAEVSCLEGAESLLASVRPVIICEVAENNSDQVARILHLHGYELLDASVPAELRRPLEVAAWNTIAIHRQLRNAKSRSRQP